MGEPLPLGNPLGKRGNACMEVMITLYGSTPSPLRCVEAFVPPEDFIPTCGCIFGPSELPWSQLGSVILSVVFFWCDQIWGDYVTNLDLPSWIRVGGRLTRVSDQLEQGLDQRDMDSQMESAQFDTTVPPSPPPSQLAPQPIPFTLHSQTEVALPPVKLPIPTTSEDPYARMDILE
ncbi:hypothetical protein AAG906_006808 [Vitis piasezkii]